MWDGISCISFWTKRIWTVGNRWKMLVIKNPKENKLPYTVFTVWLLEDKLSSVLLWKAFLDSNTSLTCSLSLPLSVLMHYYFKPLLLLHLYKHCLQSLFFDQLSWKMAEDKDHVNFWGKNSPIHTASYSLVTTLPLLGRTCPLFLSFFF